MGAFNLSKWYLDYVTESGEVRIAYIGDVRWGPLQVGYASLLETAGTGVRERHSSRAHAPPEETGSGISWYSKVLKFECAWDRLSPAVKGTVYDSKDWFYRMELSDTFGECQEHGPDRARVC